MEKYITYTDAYITRNSPVVDALRADGFKVDIVPRDNFEQYLDARRQHPPRMVISEADTGIIRHGRTLGLQLNNIWYTKLPPDKLIDDAILYGVQEIVPQSYDDRTPAKYQGSLASKWISANQQHPLDELRKQVKLQATAPPQPSAMVVAIVGAYAHGKSSLLHGLMLDTRGGSQELSHLMKRRTILRTATTRRLRETEANPDELAPWFADKIYAPDLKYVEVANPVSQFEKKAREIARRAGFVQGRGADGTLYHTYITQEGLEFGNRYLGVPKDAECLEQLIMQDIPVLWASADANTSLQFFMGVKQYDLDRQHRGKEFRIPVHWYSLTLHFDDALERLAEREGLKFLKQTKKRLIAKEGEFINGDARAALEEVHRYQKHGETQLIIGDNPTRIGLRIANLPKKQYDVQMLKREYPDIHLLDIPMQGFFQRKTLIRSWMDDALREQEALKEQMRSSTQQQRMKLPRAV